MYRRVVRVADEIQFLSSAVEYSDLEICYFALACRRAWHQNFRYSSFVFTYKNNYKLLESQIALSQEENEAVFLEQDGRSPKVGRHQALLNFYRDASNHVAKRLSDEGACIEAGCMAAVNEAEDEI